ncbi:MAG TPA: phosphoglucomutase/phosphomannomutase family protein, partial [Mobilitalea sp.]|nr:phosphoglucomutase/phosphomannomutase family protein [Mobilitalea sp.]
NGKFLHPNDILVLLYYYLVKYKGWHGAAVRNIATTHLLDKVAESFGEKCYEVPVGFKHISAKMNETDAVIGGESSGGLTVRGHIKGKDGVYAATLLVEMIAVIGKKLSEIAKDIEMEYGSYAMEERDYRFDQEKKLQIYQTVLVDKMIPELPIGFSKISYLDGCKIYFDNGGWITIRFSGTEPLLRIFCEMPEAEQAKEICRIYEEFLNLA